jgi:hypothetical protein
MAITKRNLDADTPIKKSFSSVSLSNAVVAPVEDLTLEAAMVWYISRMHPSLQMQILSDFIAFKASQLSEKNK